MGLFQRDENIKANLAPLYTLGQERTVLIVGLGNIGKDYIDTRHNIGFATLDYFADKNDFPAWINKKDLKCEQTNLTMGDCRVILCKPTTFMNKSGEAVQAIQHFYNIDNAHTVLAYDELDVEFGSIRTRIGGSAAGHNGIKSIIQHGGESTGRIRIGVGPKQPEQIDSADFVLARFNKDEATHMDALKKEVNSILTEYVYGQGTLDSDTRKFII